MGEKGGTEVQESGLEGGHGGGGSCWGLGCGEEGDLSPLGPRVPRW